MRGRLNGWTIVILTLIAIGVLSQIAENPVAYLIPIVVFGVVYFLYKFPPSRYRRAYQPPRVKGDDRHRPKGAARNRSVPFRVIDGGKDDDDLPKYH